MLLGRTETLMERSMPEGWAETLVERSMPKGMLETLMERSMPKGRTETLMERSMPEGRTETLFERSMPEGWAETWAKTLMEQSMPKGKTETPMERSMPKGRTETPMKRSMPEGWAESCLVERSMAKKRTFRRFKKHIKTSRTWRHPPYAEMVQEALVSLSPSSYWPSGDLPSTSYEFISSYILSKYPLVGEIHQLDHDILLREAIMKLSQKGILYCELTGRYVILPPFSSISAATFCPPPPSIFLPKYYQPPPLSPPSPPLSPPSPQHMEEDTAEERGLALVPVDIKRFILLPTILPSGRSYKEVCNPPPPYPPPLWEVGCSMLNELPVDIKRFILLPTILPSGRSYKAVCNPPPPYPPPLWEVGCSMLNESPTRGLIESGIESIRLA